MELRQLRYFVSVAKKAGFSRASAELNVAQSAVSRQISLLEDELGQKLLRRTGRGAVPTTAGELLLERAATLLAEVDDLKAIFLTSNSPIQRISFGVPAAFSGNFASHIVQRCQTELPLVSVRVYQGLSGLLLEWLLEGRIDLAVLYSSQTLHRPLISVPFDTKLLALVHSPLLTPSTGRKPVTLDEISELPLIMFERPNGSRLMIDELFIEGGIKPRRLHEVSAWLMFKELLEMGMGYALLPATEVQNEIDAGRLVATRVADPRLRRTLCVARANTKPPPQLINNVFELIRREGEIRFAN